MAMRITYYGGIGDMERYGSAARDYDRDLWPVLSQIRQEISRARRLAPESIYTRLIGLYESVVKWDMQLRRIRANDEDLNRLAFVEMNQVMFHEVTAQIDCTLDELAAQMQLKAYDQSTERHGG
jgi:hypothetical protein